jgi:hypothetical protein
MSSKLHDTSDGSNPNVHTDVEPGAGGVIENPNENDVLSGRGGRINSHPGNVKFRELVNKHKHQYLSRETKKLEKVKVADLIVQTIRKMDPPGRFLKEDSNSKGWVEIGDEKARKKAGQAMREKADLTRQELEHTNVKEAPGGAYAGYQAPMFHNAVPTNPIQGQNFIPINANAAFLVDAYQQQMQMQIQMQMQQRYPIGSSDSSQIPFGQPGYPPPASAIGFMQNGMPFSHDTPDHQRRYSNSMSISSSSSMPPPANQNSLYQPNQISSLPESTGQKRQAELLKENMNAVDSLIRMRSSDTSFSGMSSFLGSDNSSMLSQEQLLSLQQQQSMSMQDMPIEPFMEDTPQNESWDPSDSTQDRRRMFRQNFSQLSSFNLPVVKDDQDTSGTSTSDLMKESLLSFNASGPIQSPSHHRRISTGEMAMSEVSLNRLLETAAENSGSLLSFGTLPVTLESRFQSAPNTFPTSNPSNQSDPERHPGNANTREVYFDSDVNFESKRGLQEDASVISQSRRSSVSTWLGEEKIPGLRDNDMGSFRNFNDAGGSRLRLFSGQSYANESMRSIMSDISENMSALDLAHDYGVPQRRRSSQSNHLFQMT